MLTSNGKNISENATQFSESRFSILKSVHKVFRWIKLLFLPSVAKRLSEPKLSSFDKLSVVTNEIDDSWINLKKVIDKCPKKSVTFFHTEESGWQLEICATYL